MVIPDANEATSNERMIAALAHGSAILFYWGAIIAAALWVWQRSKSAFVSFHALQSLVYQLLQTVYITLLSMALGLGIVALSVFSVIFSEQMEPDFVIATLMGGQFLLMMFFFFGMALYVVVAVVGAILTLSRKDFRYPIIGSWLEHYLQAGEPQEVVE